MKYNSMSQSLSLCPPPVPDRNSIDIVDCIGKAEFRAIRWLGFFESKLKGLREVPGIGVVVKTDRELASFLGLCKIRERVLIVLTGAYYLMSILNVCKRTCVRVFVRNLFV